MASIFHVVERLASEKPHEVAAVSAVEDVGGGGRSVLPAVLHYKDLHEAALVVAKALQEKVQSKCPVGTYMRRGNEFYTTFLGCSYCQLPVAAMSTDHPNQEAQALRNRQILEELRPALVVCDAWAVDASSTLVPGVSFQDLWARGCQLQGTPWAPPPPDPRAALCFQYTGGTTGASRCCVATQAMALWEIEKYPEVVRLERGRVLQQHSVYWMASMAGEIDIALSFGCALVFCEARTSEEVAKVIKTHEISCAGLVPSILAELDPRSLPSLKVVFTWGEALQTRTAVQWASEVHLIDLLIASEYWLTLYADWTDWVRSRGVGSRPAFRSVSGAAVRLHAEAMPEATRANQGELLVRGPQVTTGYLGDPLRQQESFLEGWYRTSDCLEQVAGGYKFAGRADDMVKVGGVWVDTRQICEALREDEGVRDACMYSKAAFVCLDQVGTTTLTKLRRKLPADHALFVVPALPRNDVTGKVDRRRLDAMTGRGVQGGMGSLLSERQDQLSKLPDFSRWYRLLLLLLWWPVYDLSVSSDQDFFLTFLVDMVLVPVRLWLLTYLFLSYMYHQQRASKYCVYFPLDMVGLFTMAAGILPVWLLAILSLEGMWQAQRRGRLWVWPGAALLSYPKWADERCSWWLAKSTRWKDIPAWYQRRLIMNLPIRVKKYLGHARICPHCGKLRERGRVEPTIDPNWYCEECWKHYFAHWQCHRCRQWVTRGRKDADGGRWICHPCAKKGAEDPGDAPAVKRQRVEDRWVQNYAASSSATEVARSLSCSRSGPAGSSPSPARPSSIPAERRQAVRSGRSSGPRLDSRSPRRQAAATGGQRNCLEVPLKFGTFVVHEEEMDTTQAADEKSHLWRLVEEVTDFRFGSEADRVALDSMRWQRLTSRLRRQEGRNLPWDAQRRCGTLGELLREIESLPVVQGCAMQPREVGDIPGWFMMWTSRCLWKIHIRRPVSEGALRSALEELMWRHSTLRVRRVDDEMLFKHFQAVLSIVQLFWLWLMDKEGPVGNTLRRLLSVLARHMDLAWPRLAFGPPEVDRVLKILPSRPDLETAVESLAAPEVDWEPPFQALLVPIAPATGEASEAVLLLRISHMISDGFSIVPLMSDLSTLLSNAELQMQGGVPRPLPPVDSALAVLRSRISRTAQGDHSLADVVTPSPVGDSSSSENPGLFQQTLEFPPELVQLLKQAALRLAVPDEILLLTAIGVSIAKLHGKATQTLQMVVPGRDGPQDSDLVGLFADYRRLEVRTEGLSYLGAALSLHYVVKERLWRQPPSVGQYTAPFVNFEWTDFEERGGLSQIPEARKKDRNAHCPMNVVVLSPTRSTWRLLTAFRGDHYVEADVQRSKEYLQEALRCLIEEPLAMVTLP